MKNNPVLFHRIGGSRQIMVRKPEDLEAVLNLDDAHWAITSINTATLICDQEFLSFLDHDASGRIRCDEVKALLKWMLSILKDRSGIIEGASRLRIDSFNTETEEGRLFRDACELALSNVGAADRDSIGIEQLSNHEKLVSNALQNGDGVISPEALNDPLLADCVRDTMALIGKRLDLSGVDGIGSAELEQMEKQVSDYLTWHSGESGIVEKVKPWSMAECDAVFASYSAVAAKIDDYFKCCRTMLFAGQSAARLDESNKFDPLDTTTVDVFLEKSPIAPLSPDCVLSFDRINPAWRIRLCEFHDRLVKSGWLKDPDHLTFPEWQTLSDRLSSYGEWITRKPADLLSRADDAKLQRYVGEQCFARLRELMAIDEGVARNIACCEQLRKLIICQSNMLKFLHSFVSLDSLFYFDRSSMVLAGRLVMDGRHFRLCTLVTDIQSHKKICMDSNICVIYLTVINDSSAIMKGKSIAVAVTSGSMRNLFVGKHGIFITDDGVYHDVKVTDFIEQPVSIREAFRSPFFKFGEFLHKQADKYFSSRSKTYEDAVAKDIQSKSAIPLSGTAPKAAAGNQQTPAVSGTMLLMGGGVGIAAIGSSFAFMAKTLRGVSVGTVLSIFFGILLVFGAPVIAVAMVKLFRRSLSRFLEANGYAMNRITRMSLRMGRAFTFTPKYPKNSRLSHEDLLLCLPYSEEQASSTAYRIFWGIVLLLIILLVVLAFFVVFFPENFVFIREFFCRVRLFFMNDGCCK